MVRSSILALLRLGAPTVATMTLAMQAMAADVVQDPPGDQPVGTPLQWTVSSSGTNPMSYRLTIESADGDTMVFVDFRSSNVFQWTPAEEGRYVVKAAVREGTGTVAAAPVRSFEVYSRVTDSPLVTLTEHPMVALFSSPSCQPGLRMRVLFKASDLRTPDATPSKPCDGVRSMNFYVAGLGQQTDYAFRAELLKNETEPYDYGPVVTLRTGASTARIPARRSTIPPTARTSFAEDVLLQSPAVNTVLAGAESGANAAVPYATSLSGRLLWYLNVDPDTRPGLMHPVPGGTFFINRAEGDLEGQFVQEVDVLGNVIRETNRRRVSEQLIALGQDEITAFHHDALRLPGGRTAFITGVERILEGVQGSLPVDIMGDMIVVLNENWDVVWVWNSFEHLDVRRRAVLNETCATNEPGCPPFFLDDVVNDWTHTNAITYSEVDGNLLFSVRNQDWVVKVDFRDGQGNGDVLWRLGPDGDFIIDDGGRYPWLSHQHDPRFVDRDHLVVFDNGNTRCAMFPDMCFSRGQVYRIDQSNRIATLVLNFNLGSYSFALGSAQPLANGNFHFNSGIEQSREGGYVATSDEVASDGRSFVYAHLTDSEIYRSWRLTDLYMTTNSPESLAYAERLFDN